MKLDLQRIARKSVQDYFAPLVFLVSALLKFLGRSPVDITKKSN